MEKVEMVNCKKKSPVDKAKPFMKPETVCVSDLRYKGKGYQMY